MTDLAAPAHSSEELKMQSEITVDALAQEIRRVDGNHSLGAGALAEALMPFLTAALSDQERAVDGSEWHRSDGSRGDVLLYTLRENGWRRGQPLMVNDVMVRIEKDHGSTTDIEPIVQRIRSALVNVPVEPVQDDIIGYVLRYGGMCRDCADMDGICYSGIPCDTDQRRAMVRHTISALAYGIKHGFVVNPFPSPHPKGEESAEVVEAVGSHEITDFLYKHGELTYSAAARAVHLLTGNGYGFTSSSETRRESLLTMRKALNKIADMIDAEDADLDDAISIAYAALAATRSGSASTQEGVDR